MGRRSLFFLVLLFSLAARAQYAGYSQVVDISSFKSKFSETSQKTNTIKSDFVQEKNLSMLSEKIVSKGKFWFKKENAVRMEYTSPFQYVMVINGSKIYIKDNQKENRVSAKSNKLFQSINKILMDCVKGTVFDNTDFSTKLFESNDNYLAELTPVNKDMKSLFKKINVYLDKKNYLVKKIEMNEPSGDNTILTYSNQELNTNLPDALFAVN
jgi:outer membrane lipoprotein-sorting protein